MAVLPAAVNYGFSEIYGYEAGYNEKTAAGVITENGGETVLTENEDTDEKENNEDSANEEKNLNAETQENKETGSQSDFESYITGVVAAEMPALYENEALKAQAVAARTYAKRRMEAGNSLDTMIENGGQAYNSVDDMREKWGNNFDEYYNKIKSAVDDTEGEIMIYDGEPILAVFHAISGGKTESAANIWSQDEPYLKSVDSSMDETSDEYIQEETIPVNTVISKLQAAKPSMAVSSGSLEGQMQIIERTEAGYVKEIQIGNAVFTGREVRERLGHRSSDFTVRQEGENMIFTTKGYGHGAGMSQYGANELAKEGMDYHEILEYYYTGISFLKE